MKEMPEPVQREEKRQRNTSEKKTHIHLDSVVHTLKKIILDKTTTKLID